MIWSTVGPVRTTLDSTHPSRPVRHSTSGPMAIELIEYDLATSIDTDPCFIVQQLGFESSSIVHTYYNPELGWEIAVEEQQHTIILICCEITDKVKAYK